MASMEGGGGRLGSVLMRYARPRYWIIFGIAWVGAVLSAVAGSEVGLTGFSLAGGIAWLARPRRDTPGLRNSRRETTDSPRL